MNPPNPSPGCTGGTRHEPAKPATNWDGARYKGLKRLTESLRKEGAGTTPRIGSQGTHPATGNRTTKGDIIGTMETFPKYAINMPIVP
jgi:hypothetical protein